MRFYHQLAMGSMLKKSNRIKKDVTDLLVLCLDANNTLK